MTDVKEVLNEYDPRCIKEQYMLAYGDMLSFTVAKVWGFNMADYLNEL